MDKEFSTDIIDGHGGGVVDVTAFILQVIVLLALSNKLEKVIIADEAFKHVSQEYLSNVAQFMQYLNEITGIQIIMVTHKSEFLDVADKKYEVRLNDKFKLPVGASAKVVDYNDMKLNLQSKRPF